MSEEGLTIAIEPNTMVTRRYHEGQHEDVIFIQIFCRRQYRNDVLTRATRHRVENMMR